MKVTLVFVLAFAAVAFAETYPNKYDDLDLDEILKNARLFEGYENCILDKGPCTPPGKELKSHIQDALENGCAKCTQKQQDGTKVVIKDLIHNKPGTWTELKKKYDPTGKYSLKYENEYKKL